MSLKGVFIHTFAVSFFALLMSFVFAPTDVMASQFVQRGEADLSGETSVDVTLDTPVEVGKSFPLISARNGDAGFGGYPARSAYTAELRDVVDGKYTTLRITRNLSSDVSTVAWQVIEDDNFTVQTGEVSISDVSTATTSISEVDLNKSFIVVSSRNSSGHIENALPRARFTDATELRFDYGTNVSGAVNVKARWYVVEWNGASVQSGDVTLTDLTTTDTITEVDQGKSFLIYSYNIDSSSSYPDRTFVQGSFASSSSVEFEREDSTGTIEITYFVISNDSISAQQGELTVSGTTATTTITQSALATSFMPVPFYSNTREPTNTNTDLEKGLATHRLLNNSTIEVQRGESGNTLTSYWQVVNLVSDTTAPTLSSVSDTPSDTSVAVNWVSNEAASSQVHFGPTTSYGTSTAEQNTSPRVTSHSISLTNLVACTQYHYQVVSKDAAGNTATSSDKTFTTSGCNGSAPISSSGQANNVATSSTSTASHSDLTLTIPTGYSSTSTATFQINKLDATTFFNNVSGPSGVSRAGAYVYNLKALTDATTTLSSFDSAVTVQLSYSDSDVSGLDESSLKIYRYNGSSWNELSNCSVDTAANTVSCETTQFSDFSIFGTESSSNNTSSDSGTITGGYVSGPYAPENAEDNETDEDSSRAEKIAELKEKIAMLTQKLAQMTEDSTATPTCRFERDLELGMSGADVKCLQRYLNHSGFPLADTGPGSPSNETEHFGALTEAAVIKLQNANASEILTPLGLSAGTGYVGPSTRAYLNER